MRHIINGTFYALCGTFGPHNYVTLTKYSKGPNDCPKCVERKLKGVRAYSPALAAQGKDPLLYSASV